jgi:voltage-dependent anion channel protein 2
VRAKINNKSEVGLGYQQKLRDGVTVTLSTLVNSGNINAGGHKVGVALEMEA